MSVEIDVEYEGQLRCRAQHGPSGMILHTDAPVDNHGRGESYSPTDLVATALGACLLTIMGIVAQRNGLDISGTRVHVRKEMIQMPVRRIGRLPVTITFAAAQASRLTETDRETGSRGASLPVHQSLHPDIETPMEFVYPV